MEGIYYRKYEQWLVNERLLGDAERIVKCILGYEGNNIDKTLTATTALIMKGEIGNHRRI